jgi:hypothetical protein
MLAWCHEAIAIIKHPQQLFTLKPDKPFWLYILKLSSPPQTNQAPCTPKVLPTCLSVSYALTKPFLIETGSQQSVIPLNELLMLINKLLLFFLTKAFIVAIVILFTFVLIYYLPYSAFY